MRHSMTHSSLAETAHPHVRRDVLSSVHLMAIANEPKLTFKRFVLHEVVVPARRDILSAPSMGKVFTGSTTWDQLSIFLVEAETSRGFIALGEATRGCNRATVEHTLAALRGIDLLAHTPSTQFMTDGELPQSYPQWSWQSRPDLNYQLVETLWLDAVGKAAGLPAYQLLGGAVRNRVLTDFWANRPAPGVLRKLIAEAAKRGLHGIKLKSDSTGDTAQAVLAIAKDIPRGFRITIDPMNAWRSLRESARWFDALAALPFDIQIEDPFPYLVAEDWRAARSFKPLTIICHARSEEIFRNALRDELADAYNLGGGSAYAFLQSAHVAEFFGKDCWQGSALELGVMQHLRLHMAACARNCVLASDLQSEWVRAHTLINERMQFDDGAALVPAQPGLGVSLDRKALKKYSVGATA
jgi:L-alanine-DL-glutamate epimerase-like enolase superfamily enzyme